MSTDVPDSAPADTSLEETAVSITPKISVRPKPRTWTTLGIALLVLAPLAVVAVFLNWFAKPDEPTGMLTPEVVAEIKSAEEAFKASPYGRPPASSPVIFQAMPDLTVEMRPIRAMVGRFHIYRDSVPDPQGGRRDLIVSLSAQWTDAPPGIIHGPHFGTIGRELVNQALLLAARDELGMVTREITLGDAQPERFPDLFVEIIAPYATGEPLVVTVRRESAKGEKVLTKEFPLWTDGARDYTLFTAKAEAFSRGPFVETLKAAGLDGKANRLSSEAKPAQEIAGLLESMAFPAQFAAIRQLHKEIRADGESPTRLAALSRAYAQLGSLTEYQWSPADKFYKARALLYAERLVARSPKSDQALRDRAFVRALVGLHRSALDDLGAAEKLRQAAKAPAQVAPLASLIETFCRFDTNRLGKVKDGPHVGLAQLLRFLTAEDYYDSHARTLEIARESLEANPECFRLLDAMCQAGSLGTLHQVTELAPRHLATTLPPALLAMVDLPTKVKSILKGQPDDVEITNALAVAGAADQDTSELSWSALGRMIEETRFVQVWRRADFMRNKWNVPVREFLADAQPLVSNHPFAKYLESFGGSINTARGPFNLADLELNEMPFLHSFEQADFQSSAMMSILAQRHADEVYRDLEIGTRLFDDSKQQVTNFPLSARLQAVSPFSPFAAAILIKSFWEVAEPHAADWEKLFAQHPQVFGSLAVRYRDLNRLDDEKRCLSKFKEIVPSAYWVHARLAEIELNAGHADAWKAILDNYLAKTEADGLEHATVRVQIARHFMALGEWAKAQPYAEEAAQTWAGWAMECAAECYEHMEDWTQAEVWYQREAERYPVSWFQWFSFCKRTGHGNAKAAKELAATYLKVKEGQLSENDDDLAVFFYDLGDEPADGIQFLKARFSRPQHILEGMFLAMFADQIGDSSLRDDTWKRIPNEDRHVSELAAIFLASVTEKKALDLKKLDVLIETANLSRQADLCYLAGRYLERHGRGEDAQTYWRRCAESSAAKTLFRLLAVNALREQSKKKQTAHHLRDGRQPRRTHRVI